LEKVTVSPVTVPFVPPTVAVHVEAPAIATGDVQATVVVVVAGGAT